MSGKGRKRTFAVGLNERLLTGARNATLNGREWLYADPLDRISVPPAAACSGYSVSAMFSCCAALSKAVKRRWEGELSNGRRDPVRAWNAMGQILGRVRISPRRGASRARARAYAKSADFPDLRPNSDRGRVAHSQQVPHSTNFVDFSGKGLVFRTAQIDLDTTSFMISLVPPKIRVTRASRHSRAMRYSFM